MLFTKLLWYTFMLVEKKTRIPTPSLFAMSFSVTVELMLVWNPIANGKLLETRFRLIVKLMQLATYIAPPRLFITLFLVIRELFVNSGTTA